MIRSRRFALAAVVVVLGLSACGDPNTTAPLADKPQVIQLASGQTGSGGAAPAAETMDAADSKMAIYGPTEFVYDGDLPGLDKPAGSWFFPTGAQPDLDRIAKLAASLGVEGEVRTLSQEQGGGWAVGPEDYSAAVLTVGSDGMLSWWLSAAPTTSVGVACGMSTGVSEPAVDNDSSGVVPDVAPPAYTDSEGDTPAAVDAPTETVAVEVAPDCPTPEPPVGVPTKDEALAKATQLFADWGYDANSYQFDDPYADEWGASVSASLLLDGMKAPITLSVGFGENGTVTYASGSLTEPQRGADYPTIGAAAGLERLKTQQNQYLALGAPEARSAVDVAASDAAVGTAVAPDIAPCEPEAAAADCAPIPNTEPVTVTLNSVKSDLTMVWAADNTVWLLPAYSFGSADGGMYTVVAVEDEYIHQADPATTTGQTDPAVDPGVVPTPETAPPVAAGATCPSAPALTVPPAPVEQIADAVVGYCLAEAQDLAKTFGYELRVVRQDGVDLDITADFSESRINVATKGDIVSEIISIG